MATIKSYTDINQSKKLAEILPLESADMVIWGRNLDAVAVTDVQKFMSGLKDRKMNYLPCWSLAALLEVLPEYNLQRTDWGNKTEYKIVVTVIEDNYASKNYDNPVDACVAMIEKLNELNLL